MVLKILSIEHIYPQYSGVLVTCLALRYWFFEVLGNENVKLNGLTQFEGVDFEHFVFFM